MAGNLAEKLTFEQKTNFDTRIDRLTDIEFRRFNELVQKINVGVEFVPEEYRVLKDVYGDSMTFGKPHDTTTLGYKRPLLGIHEEALDHLKGYLMDNLFH